MKQTISLMHSTLLLVLSLISILVSAPPAHATNSVSFSESEQAWIDDHPSVRVRMSRTYPPFEFYADNSYQGIAYDYLTVVSEMTGLKFIPVEGLSWSESIDSIRDRRDIDMILLITPSAERESFLNFTDDYISFDWVIIADKSNLGIQGFHSLVGKTVAVERGFIIGGWLKRDVEKIKLLEVENTEDALRAVSQGVADAYVGNVATSAWAIDNEGLSNLKVAGTAPYGVDSMAMGVRKDWSQLAHIINTSLAALSADDHQQIRNRWLPVRYDYEYKVPNTLLWIGGLLLIGVVWIVQLRIIVSRRTCALQHEIELRGEREAELQMSMDYLQNMHQRLRFNIDHMPLGYIVWDTEFAVLEWNPAAEQIFGWSEEEARGMHAYALVVPDIAQLSVEKIWEDLMQGDESINSINENISRDGRRLICSWFNTPLRNPKGEVIGALSMVEDITRRHEEEQARLQQFDQLSMIFDSINALVYIADMETLELLYLNQFGQETFGAGWQGKKCYEFLQEGQTAMCPFCTNDKLVVAGETTPPYIWEFQNSVNHRWYQCVDRAIPWFNGQLVRMEIAFDITETKEIEQLKDQMVSAVSHEMRTPLTAVLGYAEFLMENRVEPEAMQEYLQTLYTEADRLNVLIDSFLNLQQLKTGQQPLSFFAVAVSDLLNGIRGAFSGRDPQHEIVIICPADIARVRGDKVQVREAISLVVGNAIKYSPAGGRVKLSAKPAGDMIEISVTDQGVGIPAKSMDRIFDRFYRADNSDTRAFGGVGIGLFLVHEIVTSHDGNVRVESEEGQGTTITLSFPVYSEVTD